MVFIFQNTHFTKLRCIPYFYQIGATKSGTTDLFKKLSLHPYIMAPKLKEPQYWNWKRLGKKLFPSLSLPLSLSLLCFEQGEHSCSATEGTGTFSTN